MPNGDSLSHICSLRCHQGAFLSPHGEGQKGGQVRLRSHAQGIWCRGAYCEVLYELFSEVVVNAVHLLL